jgi:hypothetical protein
MSDQAKTKIDPKATRRQRAASNSNKQLLDLLRAWRRHFVNRWRQQVLDDFRAVQRRLQSRHHLRCYRPPPRLHYRPPPPLLRLLRLAPHRRASSLAGGEDVPC